MNNVAEKTVKVYRDTLKEGVSFAVYVYDSKSPAGRYAGVYLTESEVEKAYGSDVEYIDGLTEGGA